MVESIFNANFPLKNHSQSHYEEAKVSLSEPNLTHAGICLWEPGAALHLEHIGERSSPLPSPLRRAALSRCRPVIPSESRAGLARPFRRTNRLNLALL